MRSHPSHHDDLASPSPLLPLLCDVCPLSLDVLFAPHPGASVLPPAAAFRSLAPSHLLNAFVLLHVPALQVAALLLHDDASQSLASSPARGASWPQRVHLDAFLLQLALLLPS